MDIFNVIAPVNLPIGVEVWLPGPSLASSKISNDAQQQLAKIKNDLWSGRSKLANYKVHSTADCRKGNTVHYFLLGLDGYVKNIFRYLKLLDVVYYRGQHYANLLALAAKLPLYHTNALPIVPWVLPFTNPKATDKGCVIEVQWTVLKEAQIAMIALSLVYFKIGLQTIDSDIYDIDAYRSEISSKTKEAKSARWQLISDNFFKKSLAVIAYLQSQLQTNVQMRDQLIETSIKFTDFVSSYLNANFRLVLVVIKNFWTERFGNAIKNDQELLVYNLQDLNDSFYKNNHYYMIIKIAAYVYGEINDLVSYMTDFKTNLELYYDVGPANTSSDSSKLVKSFVRTLVIDSDNDDSDSDNAIDESTSLVSTKKLFKKIVKRLNGIISLLKVFAIYLKLYLAKYLSLDKYIMKSQTGLAISVLDYGFSLANSGFNDRSSIDASLPSKSEKVRNKLSLKRKLSDKRAAKAQQNTTFLVSEENGLDKHYQFESLISNPTLYKTFLAPSNKISVSKPTNQNNIIIADLNNLLVNMQNLKYKLTVENDNLSFELVVKLTDQMFSQEIPLGRELQVSVPQWSPLEDNKSGDLQGGSKGGYY